MISHGNKGKRIMATFQVNPPEQFTFKPEEWEKWSRRFERFRIASGLSKKSEDSQVNALIYSMRDTADDLLLSFDLSEADRKKYKPVKDKFDSHFVIKKNFIYDRAKFNMRSKKEGEPVDSCITDLDALAEFCNFGNLRDELIRDRLVVGILDKQLSEKLQLDVDLTLEKAIIQAREKETIKKQQTVLRTDSEVKVDYFKSKQRGPNKYRGAPKDKGKKSVTVPPQKKCDRCLGNNHLRKDCPAKDAICHACEKRGHYKKACRSKHIGQVTAYTDQVREATDQMEELFVGVIESPNHETAWESKVFINDKKVSIKLDSGADVAVLSEKLYESEFHMWPILPTNKVLIGPCKTKIPCVGKMNATIKTKSGIVTEEVFIVPNLEKPLLSRKAGVVLKLFQKVNKIKLIKLMKLMRSLRK